MDHQEGGFCDGLYIGSNIEQNVHGYFTQNPEHIVKIFCPVPSQDPVQTEKSGRVWNDFIVS